jgi:hypothetical protein
MLLPNIKRTDALGDKGGCDLGRAQFRCYLTNLGAGAVGT